MTDEEKAEEFVKTEVCVKLCPTWKAHSEKCDLFPKCHYVSSKIKFYRLGLAEGRKDRNCVNCSNHSSNLRKENAELKEQNEKMKCCENCARHRKRTCDEDKKFFARASRNCNEWEMAE